MIYLFSLEQGGFENGSQCNADPEQQWREKLLGECQDEFFETFGQYDGEIFVCLRTCLKSTVQIQ